MKKTIAMLCALTLSCMIFAGCSDKAQDESNVTKKNESSAAVTTEAEDSEETPDAEKTMTQKYSEIIKSRNFSMKVDMTSDFMGKASVEIKCNGKDYCLSMFSDEEGQSDIYLIDGVLYTLTHINKTYTKNEDPDAYYLKNDLQLYTMCIDKTFEFGGSEKTPDGMICETYYTYSPDPDTGEVVKDKDNFNTTCYKYYFKEGSDHPEKVEIAVMDMTMENVFTDFKSGVDAIVLPDLKDWEDQAEANDDDKTVEENGASEKSDDTADSPVEVEPVDVEPIETDPADTEE